MVDLHGLILADRTETGLNELVACRTSASLPFAGRYRLIDFALSSLQNAGVHDVGVIMQQDYQSLLDHIGSGKEWDMSRKRGGLRLLPPFGRQSAGRGDYVSVIDALLAVEGYIRDIKQDVYKRQGQEFPNSRCEEHLRPSRRLKCEPFGTWRSSMKMKKLISALLAVCLLAGAVPALAVDAGEARAVIGANLTDEQIAREEAVSYTHLFFISFRK